MIFNTKFFLRKFYSYLIFEILQKKTIIQQQLAFQQQGVFKKQVVIQQQNWVAKNTRQPWV